MAKKTTGKTKVISFRFPEKLIKRLQTAAEADNRSANSKAIILIKAGLDKEEASHAQQEA